MHGVLDAVAIGHQIELTQLGLQRLLGNALDGALVDHAVVDQVGDGADLQPVLLGEQLELRTTRHGAVVVHDFADHAAGLETGHARQVAGCLGVAGTRQYATRLRHQREDVARADDVFGFRSARHGSLHGPRTVCGGNAGGHAFSRLDGNGELGAETGTIARRHQRQFEQLTALAGHRHADQAAGEACHEVDVLGGDAFGGDDDVALVLAVLVIHEDDHLAGADVFDQFFSGIERHGASPQFFR